MSRVLFTSSFFLNSSDSGWHILESIEFFKQHTKALPELRELQRGVGSLPSGVKIKDNINNIPARTAKDILT